MDDDQWLDFTLERAVSIGMAELDYKSNTGQRCLLPESIFPNLLFGKLEYTERGKKKLTSMECKTWGECAATIHTSQ